MKNKLKICICFFILPLLLLSCNTFILENHLKLHKGISSKEFINNDVPYYLADTLHSMNKKYNEKFVVFLSSIYSGTGSEIYYYAFRNDSLVYWGYPYQFSRHDNQVIREISENVYNTAKKEFDMDRED